MNFEEKISDTADQRLGIQSKDLQLLTTDKIMGLEMSVKSVP